jgi:pimeloyl-ACP methyl ester carboxylesterase
MTDTRALLAPWPGVEDDRIEVAGRPTRVLRAEGRADDGDDGDPQLLVHGLGGSAPTWIEVVGPLADRGPVVALDLPGFGRTPTRAGDRLTVAGYRDFVLRTADVLGWDRFTLHGNSMGGLVAMHLAAKHPDRVAALVLVSPAIPPRVPAQLLFPARPTFDSMVPIAVSSVTASALGLLGLASPSLTRRRNRELLGLIYSDPDSVDHRILDLLAADFAGGEVDERRRALLSATRSIAGLWTDPRSTWRALDRVTAPTLVLGGTKDALVPAKVLRSVLARRRDWRGHLVDDRRHALMLEDPELYLDLFASWRLGVERAA